MNRIERIQAENTPTATKAPKTCTGGIGVAISAPKPTTVVSEVKAIGRKSSSIVSVSV